MARKGQKVFEPVATPLEDDIPMTYTLVGRQEWFDTAFTEDAFTEDEIVVVGKPEDLADIKTWMFKRSVLGCDTETTGRYFSSDKGYAMNPVNEDCRIVLLQIGDREHVWVIDPDIIEWFRDVLEDDRILHLAHNWLYDFKWLLVKNKIHIRNMFCSMLAEQIRRAGLMGYKVGLSECCRRYEPHYLISKAVRSMFIHLDKGLMSRNMIKYAARDVPLLFPVHEEQVKELKAKNLLKICNLEMDVIPCTAEMEAGGVYLDESKLRLLIKYWTERQTQAEATIIDQYTKRRQELGKVNLLIPGLFEVFDIGSNRDKREALRTLGIELEDVKRATLMTVDDPFARLLGDYSAITKMTSTYGDNMLKKINPYTKRWHPRFAQMGSGASEGDAVGRDSKETTATGRFVSDAQQFPRKVERYADEFNPEVAAAAKAYFDDIIQEAKENYK